MTLQQLQYLMEVYRTGSVSQAAKNLYLAQSSLSASISALEKELGFSIFIRSKNGMMPTVQGARAIEQAARICESYQRMTDSLPSMRHVRISAPSLPALDRAFLQVVKGRCDSYFTLDFFITGEAVRKLAAFELDGAILLNHTPRLPAVEALLRAKALSYQKLACLPVTVRVGPGHELYGQSVIHPEQLEAQTLIDDLNDPLVDNEYLSNILQLKQENCISVRSEQTAQLLLRQGLGYSLCAGSEACRNDLRYIPLEGVTYTVTAVTNPRQPKCEVVDAYIKSAQQAFASEEQA